MSNQYHGSNKSKRGWRMVGICALCTCLAILGASLVGFISGGFSKKDPTTWFNREVNQNNLLIGKYNTDLPSASGYGVDIQWEKNGIVKLDGTHSDASLQKQQEVKITFASLILKAGTYTISGYSKAQKNTCGVCVDVNNNTYYGDISSGSGTFTLESDATVVVSVYFANDVRLRNVEIRPVLVSGSNAGNFYAD